jgi:hypothetical protein
VKNRFSTIDMKNCFGISIVCLGIAFGMLLSAEAQPIKAKATSPQPKQARQEKPTSGVSNSEPDIPLSVFVMPKVQKDGRDPFFPNSMHPYTIKSATNKVVIAEIPLTLNGITPGKFVMINGRTFSEGEEGDIKTPGGSRHLRCLKIKEESAIVELDGGERRELRLRQGL